MSKGWIKLYRDIQDHWIWHEKQPFDYRSAWIDLLLMVNHEPAKIEVAGQIIEIKTGQKWTSISSLAERWHWSRRNTYRFINLLKSDKMVTTDGTPNGTLLTVTQYGFFQGQRTTSCTTIDTTPGQQADNDGYTNKNIRMIKNDKEGKEIGAAAPELTSKGEEWQ